MLCVKRTVLSIVVIVIVFIFVDAVLPQTEQNRTNTSPRPLFLAPVPWLGVLLYDERILEKPPAAASVIMVRDKWAIANARDMAVLNKYEWFIGNRTNVMFLDASNTPWYTTLVNFTLHPEFDRTTLASIALLELEPDVRFKKEPILSWPNVVTNNSFASQDIYTVGFSDRNKILEQVVYKMGYINEEDCRNFYEAEELDSDWMRPKKFHCYNVRFSKETCVFDAGMALVRKVGRRWTLLGMSTWGPGCVLPARFVDFEYFIPWIVERTGPTRKAGRIFFPSVSTKSEDLDTWMLERINDSSIALRPADKTRGHQYRNVAKDPRTLIVTDKGSCKEGDVQDGQMMYKDKMRFRIQGKDTRATAVYGLSIYDLLFNLKFYTCIMVFAQCDKISTPKLWYTRTFEQGHPLKMWIKTVPLKTKPHVSHLKDYWWHYYPEVTKTEITQLMFRFEFVERAIIEVYFYGNRTISPAKIPTTTTTEEPPFHLMERVPGDYPTSTRNPPRVRGTYKKATTPYYGGPKTSPTPPTTRLTTQWWNKWWHFNHYRDFGEYDWWQG
ncbi:uncharacterized protein LOC142983206 [Anticarsia gemmatalis]|uniref:uncharacterized protein LOC142983206 n=1 Tax=Anticarsia gemmatalis TaxID=129554 RepID=UPI003F774946